MACAFSISSNASMRSPFHFVSEFEGTRKSSQWGRVQLQPIISIKVVMAESFVIPFSATFASFQLRRHAPARYLCRA
jgi:hypothetical protein